MKKIYPLSLFLCLLDIAPAFAVDTPRQSFERLNRCAQAAELNCRDMVTASSVEIYDRFASHNLVHCLPRDAVYASEKTVGSQSTIRASIGKGANKRFMRVILAEEEDEWKLDLPESLRVGMGENWEKQLDMSEELYLMMKNQFGTALNCAALQNLMQPKVALR